VVVALHCANYIQAAATVALARALRAPRARVRTLHLGAKSLRDKFHAGARGLLALGTSLKENG
jgi:hypothetical protein